MLTLADFMTQSVEALDRSQTWISTHIVLGNESNDLDSMVCALCVAYYYSVTKYENTNTVVIPLMNMNQRDFRIRSENLYVLNKLKLPEDGLVFKNNLNLHELAKRGNFSVTLVDHHVLLPEFKFLEKYVVEIFDHRPYDKNTNWGGNIRIHMKEVASCSSLVALEIFAGSIKCLCTVAMLLYTAIVFDTIGFKPEAGKAKELDEQIAGKIEKSLKITKSREDYFNELWRAHNDITKLDSRDLLMKDLKVEGDVYIPGLPMLVSEFFKRPDAQTMLDEFCEQHKVSVCVLMGLETKDGTVKRDIALYSPKHDNMLLQVIRHYLVNVNRNLDLEVEPVGIPSVIYYNQKNTTCSRKQIMPIIKKCMELQK